MIGETTTSSPVLEVSVSFGRFENDSLSWEKWSAFSPNKYLEEVEKCATPGSVAQKKAYFEAHYKKIAARKAELLEQERLAQTQSDSIERRDLTSNSFSSSHEENGVFRDPIPEEEEVSKQEEISLSDEVGSDSNNDDDPKEDDVAVSDGECQSSLVITELSRLEEDVVVKEVEAVSLVEPKPEKEEALESVESESGCDSKIEVEKLKLDDQKESKKAVTLTNKERIVANSKKKPILPNPTTTTPKSYIRRVTNSTPMSASSRISVSSVSQSSTKKFNTPSLSRNKNPPTGETKPPTGESKKVGPKSLHMSLLGHTASNSPSQPSNRKSLIMEKMGDKDIVKRAFKAFQGNFNQVRSYGDGSPLQKQVSSKRTEPKVSTSMTMTIKENGMSLYKRSVKTPPSTFGSKIAGREEKRKEFTKKPEQKSNTNAEKTRLQTRAKEAKEAEIKKLRESLNFKATPMPAFYRGQKTSKSGLDKLPTKTETRR